MSHDQPGSEMDALGRKTLRIVQWRLLPLITLLFTISQIDRTNIGYAALTMNADLGLTPTVFGWIAGIFFFGYVVLEVPSNLVLNRVGARLWITRIMVTWGLISAAMIFAQGELSFYVLRLLLGAAEAGFFPGVILYMTYWFPNRARGQMLGLFYFGAPLAFIFGGPLSGYLLELHGVGGLQGWQWLFLIEGLLAVVVGVWAFWYLDDKPADAAWLPRDEQVALSAAVDRENDGRIAAGPTAFGAVIGNLRVLHFVAIYFLIQMSVYGVIFYLPSQVAALLGTKVGLEVGLVTAIPWVCALIATFLLPRLADRTGQHRAIAAATLAISGIGIAVSAGAGPAVAMVALCFAAAGFIAVQPLFWTFPTAYLGGVAAAGGIALINALGSLGGFFAPNVKAWADASFGTSTAGLYVLAGTTLVGALLIFLLQRSAAATRVAAAS